MLKHSVKNVIVASSLALALPVAAMAQAPSLTPPAQLPATTYNLDKTHASLTWKVSHLGLSNYTARFTGLSATLVLNPQNPAASKLVAEVDPMSVETDYPNASPNTPSKDFDKELATGAGWFNATKFPSIKFVSEKIVPTGATTADIMGQLTFMGVTKPLTLKATYNGGYAQKPFAPEGTAAVGFSATGTLKRSEWGMAGYIPAIGDDVQLVIETEFNSVPQIKPAR